MSEEWTEDLLDPKYECGACAIEGQPCDVPAAVLAERSRIIKLLLAEITDGSLETSVAGLYRAIALIKGEQE